MSQDLYKEKYVKYKSKYLSLKNVEGGLPRFDLFSAGQYCLFVPEEVFNLLAAHSYFTHTFIKPPQQAKSNKVTPTPAPASDKVTPTQVPASEIVLSLPAPSLQEIIDILNKETLPSLFIKEGEDRVKYLNPSNPANTFWTVGLKTPPFGQETTELKGKTVTATTDKKLKEDIAAIKKSFGAFQNPGDNLKDHKKYKSLLVQVNRGSANTYRNINPTEQHPLHVIVKDLEKTIRSIPSVQSDTTSLLQQTPQLQNSTLRRTQSFSGGGSF
jgi:hypothetical protein